MAIEPGRVARGDVDAAMTDVDEPLLAHGPRGAVHVIAAERELDGVVDQLVVVTRHPGTHSVAGRVHVHRAAHGEGQVPSVRGVHPGPPGADRPVASQPAVPPDLHVMRGGAGHRDERITDPEVLGQVGPAVDARRALQARQVRGEAHAGVRGPVVPGPEPHARAGHPVPGPAARSVMGRLKLIMMGMPTPTVWPAPRIVAAVNVRWGSSVRKVPAMTVRRPWASTAVAVTR